MEELKSFQHKWKVSLFPPPPTPLAYVVTVVGKGQMLLVQLYRNQQLLLSLAWMRNMNYFTLLYVHLWKYIHGYTGILLLTWFVGQ